MAIKKRVKTPSGFEPEYWVLCQLQHDRNSKQDVVTFAGYKDESSFKSGCKPADVIHMRLPHSAANKLVDLPDLNKSNMNILKRAYELALLRPEFDGAAKV